MHLLPVAIMEKFINFISGLSIYSVFYFLFFQEIKMTQPSVILATASYDHTIRFWEAKSGRCYRTIQYPDSVSS